MKRWFQEQFPRLRELKIFISCNDQVDENSPIQQSLITLAQKLSHLERLCLWRVDLMESTILEFIRFASNLKEIHIHYCELEFTQKFILEIVEILKSTRTRNAAKSLKLFIYKNETTEFEEILKLDIRNYLCISGDCKHFLNWSRSIFFLFFHLNLWKQIISLIFYSTFY